MESVPAQAFSAVGKPDEMVVRMWLHGKPHNTVLAYTRAWELFRTHCGKPLAGVTLLDLQDWDTALVAEGRAHGTRAQRLAAVKSLLSFAQRLGYVAFNVGAALQVDKPRETPTERILCEADVLKMIAVETEPRRRAILRLLYVLGPRATEICTLRWRDMIGNERRGGEARIIGKGAKVRPVFVPPDLWRELVTLAASIRPDAFVITNHKGDALDRHAVWRSVKRAARRAGVNPKVSPHWLRHSHVSHALDAGCGVHVVMKNVGHASLATTTQYAHVKRGEGSASFIKG